MITNSEAIFDPFNNGFIYLCSAEDGTYWIRSVAGSWAQLSAKPLSFETLLADFAKSTPKTEAEVIAENKGGTVVAPTKSITATLAEK